MKKVLIAGMFGISLCISTIVNTCPITIINDTSNPIQIHTNDNSKPMFTLAPQQKEMFGGHDKHAKFSLLEKNPNQRAEAIIEISQHSCSADPVELKTSDLLEERLDTTLFNVGKVKNATTD